MTLPLSRPVRHWYLVAARKTSHNDVQSHTHSTVTTPT